MISGLQQKTGCNGSRFFRFSKCGAVIRSWDFGLQLTSPNTIALTNANAAQNMMMFSDLVKSIHAPPLSMPL
jgi:hypothetical protein